jgi:tetratricopeptide (TPR) repeat protein
MASCRSNPGPRQGGGAAAKTGDDCRLLIADCGGRKSKLENRNSAPLGCSSVSCEFRISSFEFRRSAIGNRQSAIPAILGQTVIAEILRKQRRSLRLVLRGAGSGWPAVVIFLLILALPSHAQQLPLSSLPVSELVEKGREFLRDHDPQQARRFLEEAVTREPKSAVAWSLLADSYAQLGWEEKAIRGYQTALELRPDSPNPLYNLGILHWKRKRFEDALRYFQAFRRQQPRDYEVLLPLADCLFELGRATEGQQVLEEMTNTARDSPEVNFQAGKLLLHHRQIEAALAPLTQALALRPDWGEARLLLALAESRLNHPARVAELLRDHPMPSAPLYPQLLGVALTQLGHYREAIPLLEGLVRGQKGEKLTYASLASAYAASSQHDQALEVLQQAQGLWPDDQEIRSALVRELSLQKDPAGALTLLRTRENKRLLPEDLELLASCYVTMNRLEEAQRFAERAVTEGGGESGLLALANILQMQDRNLEVIGLLEPHRSEFSTSAKYIFTLGLSYYNNGSYSRASDLFDITTRLDPSLGQAHYLKGNALARLGKPGLAVAYYEEAMRLAPDNALYHFQLGQVLSTLGEKPRAEAELKRSVDLNGAYAQARYELARIYFESSRDDLARAQLEEAIKADPGFEGSFYLLSQVYAHLGRREDAMRMLKQFQAIKQQRQEQQRALIQSSSKGHSQ